MGSGSLIERWRENPVLFVQNELRVRPDRWQLEVLEAYPHRERIALKACKGPGKTALLAWIAWHFLVTHSDLKIAATSIAADNLADNLWSEMAKWQQRSAYLKQHFVWTKSRIFARDRPNTWWMTARTWNR